MHNNLSMSQAEMENFTEKTTCAITNLIESSPPSLPSAIEILTSPDVGRKHIMLDGTIAQFLISSIMR